MSLSLRDPSYLLTTLGGAECIQKLTICFTTASHRLRSGHFIALCASCENVPPAEYWLTCSILSDSLKRGTVFSRVSLCFALRPHRSLPTFPLTLADVDSTLPFRTLSSFTIELPNVDAVCPGLERVGVIVLCELQIEDPRVER